ncbi:hypothetical protein [Neobacillus drentensis]|uniref:hypothetical protein n=1 Tax=Neobacillus drentensis TaxID=220684 RepID=UPI002FFF9F6F
MGLDKFSAALDLLKGFDVNLYVGEDVFKGKLIGVEADHVVLETENKYIFYYNIDKIQAITKNTKSFQPEKTTAKFQKTQSLKDLLQSFQHSWVTILSINKQKFTGVLSEIDTDFATLINGEERILIKLTHISNILKGFIREEAAKSSSSNDSDKNKDSGNKNESKDESKSSAKKEDSDKEDSKKEEKSKSESKNDSKGSDKKQKVDKKQETVVMEETNSTMVWSQPIKIESTMVQTKDDVPSSIFRIKKSHSEEKDSAKTSSELKKTIDDMGTKDTKTEEVRSSRPKGNDQQKDMKAGKESAIMQQTDNIPAPPFKIQKTEVKSAKIQETASNSSTSPNQAMNKTENAKPVVETTSNNNQNVWKQKEKEQKVFRFAGEPVSNDSQRAFPFAGWPNRNNRTSRF